MTFFVESKGYYFDQNLMAESAGYVRNSFVMASLGEYSEYEHLERILTDAICNEKIEYDENVYEREKKDRNNKYDKYKASYTPKKHEYIQ